MTVALEGGEWSAARHGRTLPPGKTWYPLYRRLGGPQGWSGWAEDLVPTGIWSADCPARSSVAIPTELPGPQFNISTCRKRKSRWSPSLPPILLSRLHHVDFQSVIPMSSQWTLPIIFHYLYIIHINFGVFTSYTTVVPWWVFSNDLTSAVSGRVLQWT